MSEQHKPQGSANSDLLTVNEVAERFKMTPATIRLWIRSGKLPAVRFGERKYLISESDLRAYLGQVAPSSVAAAGPAPTASAFQIALVAE